MQSIVAPDLASAHFKANPHPFYALLREQAPVYHVGLPGRRAAWLVTRYDDVVGALKDKRLVKDQLASGTSGQRSTLPWMPGFLRALSRNILDVDEPDHHRLRGLVHEAFTPRHVERLRERIQSLSSRHWSTGFPPRTCPSSTKTSSGESRSLQS